MTTEGEAPGATSDTARAARTSNQSQAGPQASCEHRRSNGADADEESTSQKRSRDDENGGSLRQRRRKDKCAKKKIFHKNKAANLKSKTAQAIKAA